MNSKKQRLLVVLVVVTLLASVAACAAPPPAPVPTTAAPAAAEKVAGTVTLYTSSTREYVEALKTGFEAKFPGVTLNFFRSGSGDVIAKFQAEKQANALVPDVISATDVSFFRALSKEGLLVLYVPPEAATVPEAFKYENGLYWEFRFTGSGIGYNTSLVKEKPTSWKDLLDPKFKGKVVMPDPAFSGAAYNVVATLVSMKDFGMPFYQGFKANGGLLLQGNPLVAQSLASGEAAIGQVTDSDMVALKTKGSPVDFVYAKEGAISAAQPIGIMKTTKNLPAAKALLNYMLSEEAQKMGSATFGMFPVRPGIPFPPGAPAIDMSKMVVKIDWDYLTTNREQILTDFGKVFGK